MSFTFKLSLILLFISTVGLKAFAEDGYNLWLRYEKVEEPALRNAYINAVQKIVISGNSKQSDLILKELLFGLDHLLGITVCSSDAYTGVPSLIIGTPGNSPVIKSHRPVLALDRLSDHGFVIRNIQMGETPCIFIASNDEQGLLYGTFHFLRLLQSNQRIDSLDIASSPRVKYRLLNHWDNLDRTVERGYAGFSIWDWHKLPDHIDKRYIDYARANASVGINGTVVNNVNANADILTVPFLEKLKALAEIFRPYGIKIYLSAFFNAPVQLGGTENADPLHPEVIRWWHKKTDEIYSYIPDFGGFLVKANSEGQPGPQNYQRTHADGANMLADALSPHGGMVFWRAFVYDFEIKEDRAKQAYNEFVPLDGEFRSNVMIQVKNGPIDFQPREPFHPLFGAMHKTPLMMEFQITQEYLGQGTHLVYLAPMYKECLITDTYCQGQGTTVGKIVDGTVNDCSQTGMAGVANTGTDINWTGHHFAQANWYAFGRLAWNYELKAEDIAEEWIRMTFTNNDEAVNTISEIMMMSHEACVNYMTPLGLHHIMGRGHHYGPAPWIKSGRQDWTSVYYHNADKNGIGFDRTQTGSNAVSQYCGLFREKISKPKTCPEKYLLWFHHVNWDHPMNNGRNLWEELCFRYNKGVSDVETMLQLWEKSRTHIDSQRFKHVKSFLHIQLKEAQWWRDVCLLYFQQFSEKPIPSRYEQPQYTLDYYMNLEFKYAPGN